MMSLGRKPNMYMLAPRGILSINQGGKSHLHILSCCYRIDLKGFEEILLGKKKARMFWGKVKQDHKRDFALEGSR